MTVIFSPEMRAVQNLIRERIGLSPLPNPEKELTCSRCGKWKPDEEFYIKRSNTYRRGRRSECKPCGVEQRKKYRHEHREQENRALRERRARAKCR